MTSSAKTAARLQCVQYISAETSDALCLIARSWRQAAEAKGYNDASAKIDSYVQHVEARITAYTAMLAKVARSSGSLAGRCKFAHALLLDSQEARFCAALRAFSRFDQPPSPKTLSVLTSKLSVWRRLSEPVRAWWVPKDKGGFRPLVSFGPMRTAQCLMVRDMVSVLGIDSTSDFSRKGGGGERALVQKVSDLIVDGFEWWWAPDIRGCYASIKPGHFGWLPLDRRVLRNVVFLPKCAWIEVIEPDDSELILKSLSETPSDTKASSPKTNLKELTIQLVRRGLPQGSVLSPLLSRALVGRILRVHLQKVDAEGLSYCDDLTVGARTRKEASAARQSVTKTLSSLPGGPIELHQSPLLRARTGRLIVLGYRLVPGRGYGSNPVHSMPGPRRIARFKARLARRLSAADPAADPFQVAEEYWAGWFPSQTGWTKVPFCSANLSRTITYTYVTDYLHGEPMGGGEIYTPQKPLLG